MIYRKVCRRCETELIGRYIESMSHGLLEVSHGL
jgi:hypothetical protein